MPELSERALILARVATPMASSTRSQVSPRCAAVFSARTARFRQSPSPPQSSRTLAAINATTRDRTRRRASGWVSIARASRVSSERSSVVSNGSNSCTSTGCTLKVGEPSASCRQSGSRRSRSSAKAASSRISEGRSSLRLSARRTAPGSRKPRPWASNWQSPMTRSLCAKLACGASARCRISDSAMRSSANLRRVVALARCETAVGGRGWAAVCVASNAARHWRMAVTSSTVRRRSCASVSSAHSRSAPSPAVQARSSARSSGQRYRHVAPTVTALSAQANVTSAAPVSAAPCR